MQDKEFLFTEKNLWKIFYFHGKNSLIDLINFQIFQNKKLDKKLIQLKNFFNTQEVPKLEIGAKTLIENALCYLANLAWQTSPRQPLKGRSRSIPSSRTWRSVMR